MTFDWNRREEHCFGMMRNCLASDCEKTIDKLNEGKTSLVRIKGRTVEKQEEPINKHKFMGDWPCYITMLYRSKRTDFATRLPSLCEYWFKDNYKFFRDKFLYFSGYKTLETAVKTSKCFMDLWCEMEEWMMKKWRTWMEKLELEIQKKTGVSVPKVPQSHGGIANLLKILTKTMEKQGADIRNIAKVQYAVCVQAGVMIPEVFLTDVAAALDYKEAVEALE